MASIGDILDEFFSPLSSEKLWVMGESDGYTQRVRQWNPVIQAVNRTKNSLASQCNTWQTSFKSDASWKPGKTDSPKPGAFREFVPSPPGTDPETCKSAFILYVTSKAAKSLTPIGGLLPSVQTDALYTCSIGSFNIYTTVDAIDCAAKTATLNYWMYNSMSKTSFGKFANHAAFSLSGMKTQYMWWNWVENVEWTSGNVKTVAKTVTAGW
jgi:Na+-transporting NADH:ubiquinone oxidoreductase subunit NqrB